jgi:hypothetical protein
MKMSNAFSGSASLIFKVIISQDHKSHNALHKNLANANGRKHFILLRCFGEFCQDIKREVIQFWVDLWITELEQQIEDDGFFWKLNNSISFCLNEFGEFPGSHVDLHVYLAQSKDDTIAGLDTDIGIIGID